MDFENKILSREIQENLYATHKTLSTAESCTGGRVAEAIIAVPGASDYFKGGIICYTDEIKQRLLHVDPALIAEHTAVSEQVARAMVKGAVETMGTDYAVAITGVAGPGGGTKEIPVGTIWLACGDAEHQVTELLTHDSGRDVNLATATFKVLQLLIQFLKEYNPHAAENYNK